MNNTTGRIVEIVKQHIGPNRAERRTKVRARVRSNTYLTVHPKLRKFAENKAKRDHLIGLQKTMCKERRQELITMITK